MAEPKPWQSVVEVAIMHPESAEVLVQRQGDGWCLPHLPLDRVWAGPLEHVRAAVRTLCGLETTCRYELAWAMPFWFGEILKSLNGKSM